MLTKMPFDLCLWIFLRAFDVGGRGMSGTKGPLQIAVNNRRGIIDLFGEYSRRDYFVISSTGSNGTQFQGRFGTN